LKKPASDKHTSLLHPTISVGVKEVMQDYDFAASSSLFSTKPIRVMAWNKNMRPSLKKDQSF
jgi:hypothetical protein